MSYSRWPCGGAESNLEVEWPQILHSSVFQEPVAQLLPYTLSLRTSRWILQVEHPVSEWISGVNIPSCQVMIGMGIPLHRIPDVRRMFGVNPSADTTIDFENDQQVQPLGACCACCASACLLIECVCVSQW